MEQFGQECGEYHASWNPLPEDEVDGLRVMAEWVAFGQYGKITLICSDGSTCMIMPTRVMRSKKLSARSDIE